MRAATTTASDQRTYLDFFTEELTNRYHEETVVPGSSQHASLLAEAVIILIPDMGNDSRADAAYQRIREEAKENDIWQDVLDIAATTLTVQAFAGKGERWAT